MDSGGFCCSIFKLNSFKIVVFLCCTRCIVEAVNSQLCIVLHYMLTGVGIEVMDHKSKKG